LRSSQSSAEPFFLGGKFFLTRIHIVESDALCEMNTLRMITVTGFALIVVGFSGCETPTQGAGTGAATGAIIGGIAGGNIRSAAIGAGAGALTGAAIGQANKQQRMRYGYY